MFSSSFQEHVDHVSRVFKALQNAGLKLKPSKCRLFRKEVEYLGYRLTPDGLLPNAFQTKAVAEFPTPSSLHELKQFIGLASYYRRDLHQLLNLCTSWRGRGPSLFGVLPAKMHSSCWKKSLCHPILRYPDFNKDFVLETDTSIRGLGAVLNQEQSDGMLHPIAYASWAISQSEANYAIIELETLAMVWAFTHFRAYTCMDTT